MDVFNIFYNRSHYKFKTRFVDDWDYLKIKVVFHICFRTSRTHDELVEYAKNIIKKLNKDFSKKCDNFDNGRGKFSGKLKKRYQDYVSRACKTNIVFELHDIKNKELKTFTTINTKILNHEIKFIGSPKNNTEKYFYHIWIIDAWDKLLGYSTFPWNFDKNPEFDGVVINKNIFDNKSNNPKYNRGTTLTHETGHWLGLYHTFNSKNDGCLDTIKTQKPSKGNPYINKKNNNWLNENAMFMNFMDYSDDICMFMFTKDQAKRMRIMIYAFRAKFIDKKMDNLKIELIDDGNSIIKNIANLIIYVFTYFT